jgi:hypothetical protein
MKGRYFEFLDTAEDFIFSLFISMFEEERLLATKKKH